MIPPWSVFLRDLSFMPTSLRSFQGINSSKTVWSLALGHPEAYHKLLVVSEPASGGRTFACLQCIMLTRDKLLWMEQLTVSAGADLIHNGGLQVNHDAAWHVLASASLGEEGVEGIEKILQNR